MATAQSARVPFGDKSIKGGMKTRPEHFKAKRNWKYRVRILTDPVGYFAARVENKADPSKSFMGLSLAPYAISLAASQGDAAAEAEAKKVCPLWAAGYKVERRFVSALWVISKIDDKGRETSENRILPFAFAGEKYQAITGILDVLPINPKTGQRIPLQAIEILATCTDETYQKMTFTPIVTAAQMKTTWADTKAALASILADPNDPNSACGIIDDFIEPDDRRSMIASLQRANGSASSMADPLDAPSTGFPSVGSESLDDLLGETSAPAPAPSRPNPAPSLPSRSGARAPAPAPAADSADPLDDIDSLLGQ